MRKLSPTYLRCMIQTFVGTHQNKSRSTATWRQKLINATYRLVGIATGYGLDGPGIESRWGGARFSAPVQAGPGAHQASCTVQWVPGSFPGVKSGRGVTPTPQPLLVPWSRKSRAIPLLPLWGVRPVESLSACTRVHFTFSGRVCPVEGVFVAHWEEDFVFPESSLNVSVRINRLTNSTADNRTPNIRH